MIDETSKPEVGESGEVGEKTNQGGRPTQFEEKFIIMVEDHLAEGYTLETFGGTIGFSRDTIYDWARNNAEFLNAIKRGRDRGQFVWEQRMHAGSKGGDCNPTMIIFAMKNQYKWRERDHDVIDQLGLVGSAATAPTMSKEEKIAYARQLYEQIGDFLAANQSIGPIEPSGMESEVEARRSTTDVDPLPLAAANPKR